MKKTLFIPVYLVCMSIAASAQEPIAPPPPPVPAGTSLEAPTPPPPPPAPRRVESITFNKKATTPDFFKRNPTVKGINRTNDKVQLLLKDSKIEKYDFSNENEKKAFIAKYGELPEAPMPPPPPPLPSKAAKKKQGQFTPPTIVKDPV